MDTQSGSSTSTTAHALRHQEVYLNAVIPPVYARLVGGRVAGAPHCVNDLRVFDQQLGDQGQVGIQREWRHPEISGLVPNVFVNRLGAHQHGRLTKGAQPREGVQKTGSGP